MLDLCPHNIGWPSPQERRNRRDPHLFGQQLLGLCEQCGVWNTPEGNPGQSSSVASIALTCSRRVRKEKRGGGGRDPKFPIWATKNVMVWAQVRQEFPDVRQNEREIKFIRVGDTVRTAGQLKGEPTLNRSPSSTFIPRLQEVGEGSCGSFADWMRHDY